MTKKVYPLSEAQRAAIKRGDFQLFWDILDRELNVTSPINVPFYYHHGPNGSVEISKPTWINDELYAPPMALSLASYLWGFVS